MLQEWFPKSLLLFAKQYSSHHSARIIMWCAFLILVSIVYFLFFVLFTFCHIYLYFWTLFCFYIILFYYFTTSSVPSPSSSNTPAVSHKSRTRLGSALDPDVPPGPVSPHQGTCNGGALRRPGYPRAKRSDTAPSPPLRPTLSWTYRREDRQPWGLLQNWWAASSTRVPGILFCEWKGCKKKGQGERFKKRILREKAKEGVWASCYGLGDAINIISISSGRFHRENSNSNE